MSASSLGPYESFPLQSGNTAPLYLITFDKAGRCQSPRTAAFLLEDIQKNNYTDIHIFSHGWNNVFNDALERYRQFFRNYFTLRDQRGLNDSSKYRPVVIGIVWPSTWLVLPWESTPKIAALPTAQERDEAAAADLDILQEVASEVNSDDTPRLYEFVEAGPTLSSDQARAFAEMLLPIYTRYGPTGSGAELGDNAEVRLTPEDLLALWRRTSPGSASASQEAGFARDAGSEEFQAAVEPLGWLDPRGPVRIASLLIMKDRAGRVGCNGVGPMLVQPLLALNRGLVHLIGHSFGCKVILSALSSRPPDNPAFSVLLLQPAISYLCFGYDIDGKQRQGGFRSALTHVRKPIMSTFSSKDIPLTKLFHLAVVRDSDWGEIRIAGAPPSKFAALGGFGPGGLKSGESVSIAMPSVGKKYPDAPDGCKVIGVDGSDGKITGHGDVANDFTAWAHLNLVAGDQL